MPKHPTSTRDAALRRLGRVNRWMIAGSVALAGVFAEVAAHAFPGKTVKAQGSSSPGSHHRSKDHSSATPKRVQPPAQAPQGEPPAAAQEPTPEPTPSDEHAAPPPEAPAQEAPPAEEAPRHEEPVPSPESAPSPEPAPSPPPVVSGGS